MSLYVTNKVNLLFQEESVKLLMIANVCRVEEAALFYQLNFKISVQKSFKLNFHRSSKTKIFTCVYCKNTEYSSKHSHNTVIVISP